MLYNQPLDQPSNLNAPYVNGNPKAGIQGSIVPAAGVENDQREIVEVIYQAWQRKYKDYSNTPCAAATNGDLTQLRKAIEGYVSKWFIDSPVTFKVHGPGADFPNLTAALDYLSHYRITQNGYVTLQLAGATGAGPAAVYSYNTPITFSHPDNEKITVLGAPMLNLLPTSDSGGIFGGYQLTSSTTRPADTNYNLNQILRKCFATELDFTGGASGFIINGKCPRIDGVLCVGNGTSGGGIQINGNGVIAVNMGLAFVNFDIGISLGTGGGIIFGGSTPQPIVSMGNNSYGIGLADASSFTNTMPVMLFSNGITGCVFYTGSGWQNDCLGFHMYAECNGQGGFVLYGNGYMVSGGGGTYWDSKKNGGPYGGLYARGNSFIGGAGAVFTVSGSTAGAAAWGGAYIDLGTSSSVAGTISPAVNTFGNGGAYINTAF